MKKEVIFEVESNEKIAADVFDLRLLGDTGAITAAGQFVEIALDGFFLRRPISVCDFSEGALRLIYKVVGKGTDFMSSLKKGAKLKALTGFGNGFSLEKCEKTALIAGGGVGVPPLLLLAKKLVESGRTVYAALGFNSAADVILADELKAIGARVTVATADGSAGVKGLVTDILPDAGLYDFFYACGPKPMLKALCAVSKVKGELSLEERMGCGFGACMGCAVETKDGIRRVCVDGPVFDRESLIWQTQR